MRTKSPVRIIGGKNILLENIIRRIPEHYCYVEVFGGAGHVFLTKPLSKVNIYNDINSDLVNLFITMRDNQEALMEKLKATPHSRELYNKYTALFKNKSEYKKLSDLDKAVIFLYSCFNSQYVYLSNFTSSWDHIDAHSYYSTIEKIKNIQKEYTFENLDFRRCIELYDSPQTFFYIDPPYVGFESYYDHSFTEQDHHDLANILKNIKGKFLLSYYPCDLIYSLYADFNIEKITKHNGDIKFDVDELLIDNITKNPQTKGKICLLELLA